MKHQYVVAFTCVLTTLTMAGVSAPAWAGNSVGQLGDSRLNNLHPDATRYYYAGADANSSQRTNALGDDQVLFYDFLPRNPAVPKAKATLVYLHGGGYNVGFANFNSIYDEMTYFRDQGFDAITIEYRRGWNGDGSSGVEVILPGDGAVFQTAIELAKTDVLDAWNHFHVNVRAAVGAYGYYLVAGESAGGSLASRVTLTNASLNRTVVGVIVGFGTHAHDEPVVNLLPTCIQGGLFDPIQPAYQNEIFFSSEMPLSKGLFDLYHEIDGAGGNVLMFIGAQNGHGFGAYADANGHASHYPTCKQFFKQVYLATNGPNYIEYKFSKNDPLYPQFSPGDTIDTLTDPTFRYDPYEDDLENGMTPAEVQLLYGL